MLKQILRDMFIDPEILAGLDETQKQTLFCKMREEQIRRWRLWDQKFEEKSDKHKDTSKKKKVTWLIDSNDEPWVWVMGEHTDDKTIDDILAEETQLTARKIAEIEAKELRKTVEAELSEMIEFNDQKKKIEDEDVMGTPIIDDMEIYCSVDELRERMNKSNLVVVPTQKQKNNIYNNRNTNFNLNNSMMAKRDVLQEISLNKKTQKVASRVALWEQRVIGERTTEIIKSIQKKQLETAKEAEEASKKQEELWKEQERRAKETEIQMRNIARRAREEHRKSTLYEDKDIKEDRLENSTTSNGNSSPPLSLDPSIPRPPNQEAVVKWYRDEEILKGVGLEKGRPAKWFHGLLTRADAEQRLMQETAGTFLVRVSEKIWGYAISYKDNDRCKHYLVDASNSKYQFLGANQFSHESLGDLIQYHSLIPITSAGNELLKTPCESIAEVPDILNGLI